MLKRFFSVFLLFLFLCGVSPFTPTDFSSASAKAKKVSRKKKAKKKKRRASRRYYPTIKAYHSFYLREKIDGNSAGILSGELKSFGATDVKADLKKNALQVKFSTKNLSSVDVLQKLKSLGYTVARID